MVSPSRCPPWQPERPGPTRREPRRAQRSYTTRRDTITSVIVYHTDLQGASKLFAVTKYLDEVSVDGDRVLLANREVRMETLQLDIGPSTVI